MLPTQPRDDGAGTPPRAERRGTEALVLAASAVGAMGSGAIFALLAEVQDTYGFPVSSLGLIAGSSFIAGLISQLTLARYADRGHSRLMLRAGLAVAGVGTLGFGLSSELWQFVATRLLLGIGVGAYASAARRVLVMRDPTRAGEALGRLSAAEVAGFISGPPLAAVLAGWWGLRAPFLVMAAALALTAPAVAWVREPPPAREPERKALRVLVARRGVRAGLAIAAAWSLAMGVFDAVWARFLTDLGATTMFIAVTLTLFALPLVFLSAAGGRAADRFGPIRIALVSLSLTVPLMVLYGVFTSLLALVVVALVHSVVDAVTMPASRTAVARAAPADLLAAGQGLAGAVSAAAGAVASFGAAPLYGAAGALVMWSAAAGGIAILTMLAAWWGAGGTVPSALSAGVEYGRAP